MVEEAFFHLLNTLRARHKLDAVAVAGGCGMNSVANGKILLKTPFKQVYVQAAAGDAGGAIGAACSVWFGLNSLPLPPAGEGRGEGAPSRPFLMDHAFWGPHLTNAQIGSLLEERRCSETAATLTPTLSHKWERE